MKEIQKLISIANRLDQAGLTKEADHVDSLISSMVGNESSDSFDTDFEDYNGPKPALKDAVSKELTQKDFDFYDPIGIKDTVEDFEGIIERLWDISDPDNVKHQDQIIKEIKEAVEDLSYEIKDPDDDMNVKMFLRFLSRYN